VIELLLALGITAVVGAIVWVTTPPDKPLRGIALAPGQRLDFPPPGAPPEQVRDFLAVAGAWLLRRLWGVKIGDQDALIYDYRLRWKEPMR
jgi:hypothetical protein